MANGLGFHVCYVPGTFVPLANKRNDYLIDRLAQKRGESYSGVIGIAMQDASIQESAGPIQDRTRENLVSTDNGIIMTRRLLLRTARALRQGMPPPALDPAAQRVRSAAIELPKSVPFFEGARAGLFAPPGTEPMTV
jgi:hypothetical protein